MLQEGHEVVCFEMSQDACGFWRYQEDPEKASVYKSVHIDTPRDVNSYGDRPWSTSDPVFVHNSDIVRYLEHNISEFALSPLIVLGRRVTWVTHDVASNSRWEVRSTDASSGRELVDIFDGVCICTGRHGTSGFVPHFTGMDHSSVRTMHSSRYKYPSKHGIDADSTVVVVGVGNSGMDIVTEVSQVARNTVLVSRSGCWVDRLPSGDSLFREPGPGRLAIDCFFRLPWWWQSSILEARLRNDQALLNRHGLRPSHRRRQQHDIVTGLHGPSLHELLARRRLTVCKQLRRFSGARAVELVTAQGEARVVEPDLVIFATGFRNAAGFVDPACLHGEMGFARAGNDVPLYKGCLALPRAGSRFAGRPLLFCNFVQTATFMAAELQSRWYARVLSGAARLPPLEHQLGDMLQTRNALAAQYIDREQLRTQHGTQVPRYYDELAREIGCEGGLLQLLRSRPTALWHWYFGGSLVGVNAVQYRLVGPGAYRKAEQYIEALWESTVNGVDAQGRKRATRWWLAVMLRQMVLTAAAAVLLLVAQLKGFTNSNNMKDYLAQNVQHLKDTNSLSKHSLTFGEDSASMAQASGVKIAALEHINTSHRHSKA